MTHAPPLRKKPLGAESATSEPSSFSVSGVSGGPRGAFNLSSIPSSFSVSGVSGGPRGAFNLSRMPSSGTGGMLSRKDYPEEAEEEDDEEEDDSYLFTNESWQSRMQKGSTTKNMKMKRPEIASAPPNTLVENSIWDGTNFDGNAMDAAKQSFITEVSRKYAATLGSSHRIKESGGVNNKNGLMIHCDADGKCSWEKKKCVLGLKAKCVVTKSLSKVKLRYCCVEHSIDCEVQNLTLFFIVSCTCNVDISSGYFQVCDELHHRHH